MQSSCTSCHGSAPYSGGVPFRNYTDVAAAVTNGSLLNSLKGSGVPKMPPVGSFSACKIRQFEIWINNGHLNK
jgi:mono/diheme cytochrome c family protein